MSSAIARRRIDKRAVMEGKHQSRDQVQWAMRRRRTQSRPILYRSGVQYVRRMRKGDDDA
jgi:hypothetical protein